jgi:diguanylate cyclase (GGDEF)-like protein
MLVAYKQIAYLGEAILRELDSFIEGSDLDEAQARVAVITAGTVAVTATGVLAVVDREAARNFTTGMLGKKSFYQDLERRLAASDEILSIVAIDLDGLKAVNEKGGHAAGDDYLRAFGTHLSAEAGNDGQAYHLSGDEFAVILEMTEEDAKSLVESIRDAGPAPFSFGVSSSLEYADELAEFVALADDRQLEDKRTRRAAGLAPVRTP